MTKRKRSLALLLALLMLLSLSACGSRSSNPEDEILESTGGRDVERAPALDQVFSLNSNSRYSKNPFVATNHATAKTPSWPPTTQTSSSVPWSMKTWWSWTTTLK